MADKVERARLLAELVKSGQLKMPGNLLDDLVKMSTPRHLFESTIANPYGLRNERVHVPTKEEWEEELRTRTRQQARERQKAPPVIEGEYTVIEQPPA